MGNTLKYTYMTHNNDEISYLKVYNKDGHYYTEYFDENGKSTDWKRCIKTQAQLDEMIKFHSNLLRKYRKHKHF